MTRSIMLNGIKCEVSKAEATEAEALRLAMSAGYNNPRYAQQRFNDWYASASNESMRNRRYSVGIALRLEVNS